ncbi:YopX family protein [Paenibacillus jamilae]|uniref:YopX protein domain-containing protein n=1 Tax=Bacillus thuringiensis serovar subtoxicus TaxID=475791 RepID=A0A9X6FGS6_BACTU|nr:YopX family protein [Bacillus thuringiensis]MEB4844419.1 YopX family protein [Paenibacillus jamilae]MEB8579285.1 YopX family protein [Bacillus cereus]MCR6854679.1 YopX family protein [Bacillus thuringiensis]MDR4285132.1 hypothetical protein [Bacillus thuringiensis]MEB8593088.1 YopX family protein [Bacillus cereus]
MREIKFRAFDKVAEKIYDVGYIDFANEVVQVAMNKGGICYGTYVRRLKDVVLLQYTGLKDKNGNDIYIGDLVRWTRVIYTDCSREVIESTEVIEGNIDWLYSTLILKTEEFSRLLSPHLVEDQNEFEVIGNGYDNPKILKN